MNPYAVAGRKTTAARIARFRKKMHEESPHLLLLVIVADVIVIVDLRGDAEGAGLRDQTSCSNAATSTRDFPVAFAFSFKSARGNTTPVQFRI